MKTITMNVPATEEMKKQIIASETLKLKKEFEAKKAKLDKELLDEIEKMKVMVNQISVINANVEIKPVPKKRGWTDTEIEKLKELHGSQTPSEIAKILNKPKATVITKLSELNLKPYKWTNQEVDILVELHAKSLSDDDISKKMKIPVKDITDKITELKNEGVRILRKVT